MVYKAFYGETYFKSTNLLVQLGRLVIQFFLTPLFCALHTLKKCRCSGKKEETGNGAKPDDISMNGVDGAACKDNAKPTTAKKESFWENILNNMDVPVNRMASQSTCYIFFTFWIVFMMSMHGYFYEYQGRHDSQMLRNSLINTSAVTWLRTG